jgi:VWFA-related protein
MALLTPTKVMVAAATAVTLAITSAGAHASAPQSDRRPPQRETVAQQGQEQQYLPPQFTADVGRVLVDVTVVDEQGNFVSDLTAADFRVLEEGRAMDVNFFALERFRADVPGVDDHEHAATEFASLVSAPLLPRYMVLFIDGYNTSPSDWAQVRQALNSYLDEQLRENDRILLATLTPSRRLMVAPDFTRDVESLKRSINELATNPYIKERERQNQQELLRALYEDSNSLASFSSGDVEDQIPLDQEANVLRQGASMAQVFAGQRKGEVLYTLDAMTALALHLTRTFDVPGPKTMIMVSAGISQNPGSAYYYILDARLDQASARARTSAPGASEHPVAFRPPYAQTIEAYLMQAVGRLNRLNYTLYTIAARGVGASSTMPDSQAAFRSNLDPGTSSIAFRDEQEGLRMLAAGTGGLAFDNSANFAGAFQQIDRDTAFRYVLGYTPPDHGEGVRDGKFYRLRVEVDRDRVKVRARRGYVNS